MKKNIFIFVVLFILLFSVNADEISDVAKNNIGKVVNVYLSNYYNTQFGFIRGNIIEVTDKILIISAGDKISNPSGANMSGKIFIRIDNILAIGIADK